MGIALYDMERKKRKFLDVLCQGVLPYVNVHKVGDLISNAAAWRYGVPPHYRVINKLPSNGCVPNFMVDTNLSTQAFLVKSLGHVGVLILDHNRKVAHNYDVTNDDLAFRQGYTVARHESKWSSIPSLYKKALEISETYEWFITEPQRMSKIPELVKAGKDEESRGVLGYCAVYSQVVLAWHILFGTANFVDYVENNLEYVLTALLGRPREGFKTGRDVLVQLAMTLVMHNGATVLATNNRARLQAETRVPTTTEFLKSIKLGHLVRQLKEFDITDISDKNFVNDLKEMGVTDRDFALMRYEAGKYNLTDTPVLVHLVSEPPKALALHKQHTSDRTQTLVH